MNYQTSITEASFPGYVTGLANVTDKESMNGIQGYFSEIRKLTDLDGSIWWWPYPDHPEYGKPKRNNIAGKCAWASGVFAALFVSDLLGIRFDASSRVLTLRPFSPTSDYSWKDLKIGTSLFDLEYRKEPKKIILSITNNNDFSVDAKIELMFDLQVKSIFLNEEIVMLPYVKGRFLASPTIQFVKNLLPYECARFVVSGQDSRSAKATL